MDIIRDILDIVTEHGFDEKHAVDLEREVRRRWGGERVYISKEGYGRPDRDASIVHEWSQGDRADAIAKRHGISTRRVRQIISAAATS